MPKLARPVRFAVLALVTGLISLPTPAMAASPSPKVFNFIEPVSPTSDSSRNKIGEKVSLEQLNERLAKARATSTQVEQARRAQKKDPMAALTESLEKAKENGQTRGGKGEPAATRAASFEEAAEYGATNDKQGKTSEASGAPTPLAASTAQAASTAAVDPLLCQGNANSQTVTGWVIDHYRYCKIDTFSLQRFECIFGTVICNQTGTGRFRLTTVGRGSPRDIRMANFTSVMDQWQLQGDMHKSILMLTMLCDPTVGLCDVPITFNQKFKTLGAWAALPTAYFELRSSSFGSILSEQLTEMIFEMNVALLGPLGTDTNLGENSVRCDSASYLPSVAGGCVFNRVTEQFVLSMGDPSVDESANHIWFAQFLTALTMPLKLFKNIPGAQAAAPLTRLYWDDARRALNRSTAVAACNQLYPGYAALGQDCDEYPFASTYQGASLGDYSVRAISLSDNRTAGARLGTFYSGQRIIDRWDPFYAVITA